MGVSNIHQNIPIEFCMGVSNTHQNIPIGFCMGVSTGWGSKCEHTGLYEAE
jgi:hypothetical protein